MLVCGLDEAGRGSIVGPLVVGAVMVDEGAMGELARLGVKDSKLLTPERRRDLRRGILRVCRGVAVLSILPQEIDRYVARGKKLRRLNYLEAIYMARAVDRLSPHVVYADACDTNPGRFSEEIRQNINVTATVIAEHHADANYPVVSAASIIAKVERDNAIEKLRERFGDFGSGYPSDARTVEFLTSRLEKEGSIPAFCRSSWKTWLRISQRRLTDTWPV